jgi:ATP-dependent helicase/nuclease subunit A
MNLHQNLMIEAGAGTGKTTRLVKAVLQTLFVKQISLDSMVALTFTNKAAGELKERVASALHDVLQAEGIDALRQKPWWPSPEPALRLEELKTLALNALSVVDRADIATIHSFAFSLLKRFPLAAGIDPGAEIDDKGLRFDALFKREWPRWLAQELAEGSSREKSWLDLLDKLTLSEIEEVARPLSDFQVPLDKLPLSDADLPAHAKKLHDEAKGLLAAHPGTVNANQAAEACEEVLGIAAAGDWGKLEALSAETLEKLRKNPGSPKAWSDQELGHLKSLQGIAENILLRGDRLIALLTEMLKPFITAFRATLLTEGCLSHNALLYLCRELVRDHPDVRAQMKRDIQMLFIDEFQDTDPLQAELLLYLAEKPGSAATAWRDILLEPGKLFIVGDPKQSIYRFRGADIAAYEDIGEMLTSQGGQKETLQTNYRSQAQIIHCVNTAFETIIQAQPKISPPYIAVEPHHPHDPKLPVQDVEIWIAGSDEKQTVEEAQATEAALIASWIDKEVGKIIVPDRTEGERPLAYRDIALIFRTYGPMDRYIEALRRHDIPFVVESERYFYTTPEVTDFVNLLRAADNPLDDVSLVGFLRSPLCGLTDEAILRAKQGDGLDSLPDVRWIRDLGRRLGREPLSEVLHHIFEDTFLMELSARSYHGDQTVANLLKLRRLLEGFAAEGLTTMGILLDKLQDFFEDDKLEGENPLADENYDAVKLLTIHKAKGLEYPVVFLPSLHSELTRHRAAAFHYDWRTQRLGIQAGAGLCNLDKLLLDEETKIREAAEQNRILYVAMTRAKQRLVLSGGINLKGNRSKTFLNRLAEAWGLSTTEASGIVPIGASQLRVTSFKKKELLQEKDREQDRTLFQDVNPQQLAALWQQREKEYRRVLETPRVLTPSSLTTHQPDQKPDLLPQQQAFEELENRSTRDYAKLLGTLLHSFLEHWDFRGDPSILPSRLTALIESSAYASANQAALLKEAQEILSVFLRSPAYEELSQAVILGREMPFFYRDASGALMRGVMDIVYKRPDGTVVVGDYKTDQLRGENTFAELTKRYQVQGLAYQHAIQVALGLSAEFKLLFLRAGNSSLLLL